ncbi:aldo/keto reductase [Shouchella hunanensis]|uniref:Aldo/keto reductase n=1 Tax=Shouchella hunanensis TaxID=766894 RepID=A0ABY7W6D2_9BACI|nr:aldo/keto reductase [Shouchella hunanensis]WDF03430.1 aldo/keto reductase [Shouchella hunanensis]
MLKTIQLEGLSSPVSSLIMGSDYFTPENQDTASQMIENYLRIGGNTIDTAFIYSGGLSEQAIGNWLDNGNRDRVNIWTKGGHPNQNGHTITKAALQEQLKISLDRLKTDHVELYALHRDDPTVPVGHILEWLNEFVEDGYISTFGGSNWETSRLEEANQYASTHGLRGFSFSSPNLSLAKAKEAYWPGCISLDASAIKWHQQSNIPVLSWSSQARGFFTGRFDRNDFSNEDLVRVFYNDDNWKRFDRAAELADKKGVTTIEIALAYVLNQSFPTAAIIGPQNKEEMVSCAQGASIVLSEDEINWLNLDVATHSS